MLISKKYVKVILKKYTDLKRIHKGFFHKATSLSAAYITDMLQEIIDSGIQITPVIIEDKWCEIDTAEDLEIARKIFNQK